MIQFLILAVLPLVLGNSIKSEICPDGSFCSDNDTCCQLSGDAYGCCKMPNAVCCDDHKSCCPQNYRCGAGSCFPSDSLNKTAKIDITKSKEINCSGSEYVCPDDSTCCEGQEKGSYACCPMRNAVCCKDHQHCCPAGMICDLESKKCLGSTHVSLMYNYNKTRGQTKSFGKFAALEKPRNVSNIVCPGSESQCPDDYTCCQLASGDWGCCPFPNAICCPDREHCCPSGMQCDSTSQSCQRKGESMDWALKIPANSLVKNIICPDKSSCSSFSTCCELKSQKYGCCPYPYAECCGDGSHCCPEGYECDVVEKLCIPKKKALFFENDSINMV